MKKQNKTTRGKYEPLQLAYIAGFFDGEGTVCITKTKSRYEKGKDTQYIMIARVVGTKKEVIQLHYDLFSPHRTIRSYNYRKDFMAYDWSVTSKNALEFLKIIEPYIILKKKQFRLGIEFQERKNSNINNYAKGKYLEDTEIKWREEYRQKMQKLNAKNI